MEVSQVILVHTQVPAEILPQIAIEEPEITMKCHSPYEAISTVGKNCASWETMHCLHTAHPSCYLILVFTALELFYNLYVIGN